MIFKHKRWFDRLKFRHQLSLIFMGGIIVLTLVTSFVVSNVSTSIITEQQIKQSLQVTESLAGQSELALLYQSAESARDVAENAINFPGVKGITIETDKQEELFSLGREFTQLKVKSRVSELSLVNESSDYWVFSSPVMSSQDYDNQLNILPGDQDSFLLGYITVLVGKDTQKLMQQSILNSNLVISSGIAVLLLVLLLSISLRVTKPIEELSATMKKAKNGDSGIRSEIGGPEDITAMQASFNGMMEVLESRRDDLHMAMQSALESAKAKGEFAANVTHELRTPMNAVLGMLDLLLTMGLSLKQQEYVQTAQSSGYALLRLIDEVLSFSEADAGKVTISNQDCMLEDTLDDVVGLLASQALKKHIDIGYMVDDNVPLTLHTDCARIRQVLINLVGNGIKFTESGEVSIYVSLARGKNRIERAPKGITQLIFTVKDTGIGIRDNDQERIFEAFTQVDSSTTKEYQGTGLGLAICKQIVELMGGQVSVASALGEGSQFSFTIPIEVVANAEEEPRLPQIENLRILVVTKSPVMTDFASSKLAHLGAETYLVRSGLEAFEAIRGGSNESSFDVMFVDQDLADIKFDDFLRVINKEPRFKDRMVVMLSNPWSSDPVTRDLPLPRLNKPLKSDSFFQCLSRYFVGATLEESSLEQIVDIIPDRPCKVLVVDDNRANQQVAVAMLDKLGCESDIAGNGRDGVEKIVRDRFDLVLMDCNMPVMSGYDATAQVRQYEGHDAGHLPIIAMTANNSKAEASRCKDAGMSDFLPKPLSLAGLRHQLEKWAQFSARQVMRVAEPQAEYIDGDTPTMSNFERRISDAESPALSYDPKVMASLKDAVGDVIGSLIEAFQEDMLVYLANLTTAIEEQDARRVHEIAHTIKGSASNFGAYNLVRHSKELEDRAGVENLDNAATYEAQISEEFSILCIDLKQEVSLLEQVDKAVVAGHEQSYRILVADDDRSIRLALVKAFEREDYQSEEASNGMQAIEICKRRMPDLILMDAMMPQMNGFDACQHIRDLPNGADIPVLMITGLEDEDSIIKAFSSGATDYISKPINFSVMKQRVARLIKANRAEKHVKRLAYHDPLTSLPNRTNLMQHLQLVVNHAAAENEKFAILFLDLDRFKMINDTMGHDAGDLLLKAVSDRIRNCVREQDFIARLGGDEFTIVLEKIEGPETAAKVAAKICHSLSQAFVFMQKKMFVTTSIGISIFPDNGSDVSSLIKHADSAMFKAKEKRNEYCFYETGMEAEIADRLEMERELRQAIERNELELYYQPKIDFRTGNLVGAEALVRWNHPTDGILGPNVFIPLAEESGLINRLSDWVLEQGAGQLHDWLAAGYKLTLALNLSVKDLMAEELHGELKKLVSRHSLPKDVLELEITESTLMNHPELMSTELVKIKSMGISVAIDDFGSGYSSLNYLKRLPVDVLKIDRSFIQDIETDPSDSAIVSGIVGLAQNLDMKTVAEGVETEGQREILRALGCDSFQGYLVAKPLPAADFEVQFLKKTVTSDAQ